MLQQGEFGQMFRSELGPEVRVSGPILTHNTKGDVQEGGLRPAVVEIFWPQNSADFTTALEKAVRSLDRESSRGLLVKKQKDTFIGDTALQSIHLTHDEIRGLLAEIAPVADYQEHIDDLMS